jgi:hypothetical protein
MKMDSGSALFLVFVVSGVGMLLVRLLKARKSGLAALKLETINLGLYSFMCGSLIFFVLTTKSADTRLMDPLWMILLVVVFMIGFSLRFFALFRMMGYLFGGNSQEKK